MHSAFILSHESKQMIANLFHAAPNRSTPSSPPQIAQYIAQIWLALGVLSVVCIPALRGRSEWIGALPFWLIGMPLANLLILRGREVLVASRQTLAHLHRRRAVPLPRPGRASKRSSAARYRPARNQLRAIFALILR